MGINNKSIRNARPQYCKEKNPTSQSVIFCGVHISLSRIADKTGYSISAISKIFSGKNTLSLKAAKAISKALGMGLQSFVSVLENHLHLSGIYARCLIPSETQEKSTFSEIRLDNQENL